MIARARSRGQALAETAIFLPITLLVLFGVIWAAQYGVMSERVESAIRYSGLISNQLNPYVQYSFYVLYNSVGTSGNTTIAAQTCNPPTTDALTNSGTYPGPTSGPFWQATPAPPTAQCTNTTSQAATFSSGMNQAALALANTPSVSAAVVVPSYMQKAMGFGNVIGASSLAVTATLNFFKPADMSTMLNCSPAFQSALGASLAPTPVPTTLPAPTAFPEPAPSPTQIPISASC